VVRTSETLADHLGAVPDLAGFWSTPAAERQALLLDGIAAAHAYHFVRNTAYRNTVAARGVGPTVGPNELPRLLRPTSQAFKSYADILGTPFAQDRPSDFVEWLAACTSVDLRGPGHHFRRRYLSLESLLKAIERTYSRLGLEMLTSRGTSGHATIIPRDRRSTDLAAESYHLCLERYLGVKADHTAILMMPKRSRIATSRMARLGVQRAGLSSNRIHFTVPLPARSDQLRIRAGRTYRRGWRGAMEKRVWHQLMSFAQSRLLDPQAVESAITHLIPAAAHGEKVLLFGSLDQLHRIASVLLDSGREMTLAPGSLLGIEGGTNEAYAKGAVEIRQDLQSAFRLTSGDPVPLHDVYGMAEANWAAMQCTRGNYHVPPWVHAVTLGDDELVRQQPRSTGLLAFFDPFGGGDLFPAFFRTADQATLVKGRKCTCGEVGDYLEEGSIRRLDLLSESGCASRI
jgi:Acyl-protein synthetase, LuxE